VWSTRWTASADPFWISPRFDRHGVSFVPETQQFNTTSSIGRLTLNILLSFAQFGREIISERTRDKVCAARKKGKWVGGHPVLGAGRQRALSGTGTTPRRREYNKGHMSRPIDAYLLAALVGYESMLAEIHSHIVDLHRKPGEHVGLVLRLGCS
jgi:hypothetical protein